MRDKFTSGSLAVLASLCFIVLFEPIEFRVASRLLGAEGDNIQYVFILEAIAQAVVRFQNPFVYEANALVGDLNLAATDVPFALGILFTPLTRAFGGVIVYNILLFLGHFLLSAVMYHWGRDLTSSRFGGLVAGGTVAFSSYQLAHADGHLNLVLSFCVPLSVLIWRSSARLPLKRHFVLGFVAATCSQYYFMMLCLLVLPVRVAADGMRQTFRERSRMEMASFICGGLIATTPYLLHLADGGFRGYVHDEMRFWSASLWNYLLPQPNLRLWEEWMRPLQTVSVEHTLYIGVLPLFLSLIGMVTIFSPSISPRDRRVLLVLLICGLVLSFGPATKVFDVSIWMPAALLEAIPVFGLVRIWSRFGVVVLVVVALLTALAVARLLQDISLTAQLTATLFIFGALVLDLHPPHRTSAEVRLAKAEKFLSYRASPGDLIYVSRSRGQTRIAPENYRNLYAASKIGRRTVGYIHPHHRPERWRYSDMLIKNLHTERASKQLCKSGIRYLISSGRHTLRATGGLKRIRKRGDRFVADLRCL